MLGYKGLPFEVEWVEYPDIAPKMKELGAAPGELTADGTEKYTLPVLRDPNTGAIITDSWEIAVYLDNTYPEKPVFPEGTKGLISAFATMLSDQIEPAKKFPVLRSKEALNERSAEYFLTTRQIHFNQKIEEWSPEGPEREKHWSIVEKALAACKAVYDKTEGKWLMGNTFSYADILVASRLLWFKRVLRDDEWKRIAAWHDGYWERSLADIERECKVMQ